MMDEASGRHCRSAYLLISLSQGAQTTLVATDCWLTVELTSRLQVAGGGGGRMWSQLI